MNPGELPALSPQLWIARYLPQYPAFLMGAGDPTQVLISESRPSTFKPEPTPWFLKPLQWMSGHEPLCVSKILTVSPHHTTPQQPKYRWERDEHLDAPSLMTYPFLPCKSSEIFYLSSLFSGWRFQWSYSSPWTHLAGSSLLAWKTPLLWLSAPSCSASQALASYRKRVPRSREWNKYSESVSSIPSGSKAEMETTHFHVSFRAFTFEASEYWG